ncbi:hypothetical protein [Megasphaera massiliensis]|mgnify:CR=1 FL=1|jgi:hypothetical protein|uniref:hypothetical protein n=1 Tax=Megasphaera massiliensis TaxID=1232428 RepID=UPI0004247F03|nr:hypothetical protein [Megasphaera massiliensis]MCQ5211146.1 hypothetical protein [Megasphaera massiliensis]DAF68427.1 MAG TPA: hypothetical protein [Caudoviricetes sp.]
MKKDKMKNQVKSTMWSFLMMGGQKANIPALKEAVLKLCKATRQKTAGQRRKNGDVDWDELWIYQMTIVCEATALVLSGELDKLEEGENKDD